jgi:hypothetical protein
MICWKDCLFVLLVVVNLENGDFGIFNKFQGQIFQGQIFVVQVTASHVAITEASNDGAVFNDVATFFIVPLAEAADWISSTSLLQ